MTYDISISTSDPKVIARNRQGDRGRAPRPPTKSRSEQAETTFAVIEAAALAGIHCPLNEPSGGPINAKALRDLVSAGRVRCARRALQ